jgi:drug/metabolite transporter (DMT)-like permease
MFAQLTGMAIAVVLAVVLGESIPTGLDIVWCVIAGILGGVGITMLYRGLAIGRMGIVAPVTGVLAAVIPVVAGIILEGVPPPLVVAGIVIAIIAVVLVSRVEDEGGGRAGLNEALIGGVAIGLFGVAIAQISEGHVFSALTLIRLVQAGLVGVAVVVLRAAWRPGRNVLPAILIVGVLDMAGNAFYLLGVQSGALAIAAILSSLYPVVTVILATLVLAERVTRDHAIGIGLAVVAIVCIGVGAA